MHQSVSVYHKMKHIFKVYEYFRKTSKEQVGRSREGGRTEAEGGPFTLYWLKFNNFIVRAGSCLSLVNMSQSVVGDSVSSWWVY